MLFFGKHCAFALQPAACSRLLWSLWVRGAWVRDVGVNGAGVERHVGAWVRDVGVFYGADDGRLTGSAEEKSNNRVGNRE